MLIFRYSMLVGGVGKSRQDLPLIVTSGGFLRNLTCHWTCYR
jgi:hypothetical protein